MKAISAPAVMIFAVSAAALRAGDLADELRRLDTRVLPADSERARNLPGMLGRDARARIDAANRRETDAWHKITTRQEWER